MRVAKLKHKAIVSRLSLYIAKIVRVAKRSCVKLYACLRLYIAKIVRVAKHEEREEKR